MVRHFLHFFLFLIICSCIEPYEFVIVDNEPVLVVEGYIADKSFNETLLYPSNGRYFTVKLSLTGEVNNVPPVLVSGATVRLISDEDEELVYTETETGVYSLLSEDFRAVQETRYKLRITLPGEDEYESEWEALPVVQTAEMSEIYFTEKEVQVYTLELGKDVIKTIKGITANVNLPENSVKLPIYYRWQYTPMWIYKPPITSVSNPGHICWVTDDNYLKDYALQMDIAGGYGKELLFMPTVRNERIFEDFTLLVTQHTMTESHYYFWKEMQEQSVGGIIFDSPPYNLQTNIVSVSGDKRVVGYFGVVNEQAKRWYFNKKDLSYFVPNTLLGDCTVPFQDPAPECFDCREYSFGNITEEEPLWWR